jgi:hypothetical protein
MAANLSSAKEGPAVLVELGVVEAVSGVLEVLNGAKVIDASRRYGMVPPRDRPPRRSVRVAPGRVA